jgi:hypothetical protein
LRSGWDRVFFPCCVVLCCASLMFRRDFFFPCDYFSTTRSLGEKCGEVPRYLSVGSSGMPRGVLSRGSSCSATAATRRQSRRTRHSNPANVLSSLWKHPSDRPFPALTETTSKQQPCPTNPTTTSPAPHHHHHPRTTWTPFPPPQPAQPPSHHQKKNGNPTPKENGKNHCSN